MRIHTMAWRSLRRSKRRSFISAFSIGFGVLLAVTFTASGDYSYTNMIETSAVMGLGHVTLAPVDYNDSPSLSKYLPDAEMLSRQILENEPGVKAARVRIMGQAMFAAGSKSVGGVFMAIDPERESADYNLLISSLKEGKIFSKGDERGVVIGEKMAEKLKLRLGKKLILTVTDKDGEIVSVLTRVRGIFRTGDHGSDFSMVLLPMELMRKVLRYNEKGATYISLYLADHRQAQEMVTKLQDLEGLAGVEILPWQKTQGELAGLVAVDRLFNYLLQLLVGLVIAAGIMNTMLMSVLERSREFGIMMAIGMRPGQIVYQVIAESFLLGVLGLGLGIIITTPWFYYMAQYGIDFSGMLGDDYSAGGVVVEPVMKFRLYKESGLAIVGVVFMLTLLAGIYPAVRAGRIPPVESIKEI